MNPSHTMNPHPQNSFLSSSGAPFGSNIYSGYPTSMSFYAHQETSSSQSAPQSPQTQLQYDFLNMNAVHTKQSPIGTDTNGLTQKEFGLVNYSQIIRPKDLTKQPQVGKSNSQSAPQSPQGQLQYDFLNMNALHTKQSQAGTCTNGLTQKEFGVVNQYNLSRPKDLTKQSPIGTGANGLVQKESSLVNQDNLNRLKELIATCRANPNILNIPELSFFKEYLESYKTQNQNKSEEKETTVYIQKKSLGKSCKISLSPIKPMEEGIDYQMQGGVKPFICNHCGKCWTSLKNLKRHMVTHTGGDGTFKCKLCDKIFAYSSSLEYHIKAHKGVKPFACQECGKAFSQKNRLQMHVRTHTGERPYKCNLCESAFKQYNAYKTHELTHTDEKPFECNQCEKCFKNKDQLTKHTIRNHTHREKKYNCNECGKSFYTNGSLEKHELKMHIEGVSYQCSKCPGAFRKRGALTKHILKYHTKREKNHKCTECDKAFYHQNSLKIHMKKHPEVKWVLPEDEKLDSTQEI